MLRGVPGVGAWSRPDASRVARSVPPADVEIDARGIALTANASRAAEARDFVAFERAARAVMTRVEATPDDLSDLAVALAALYTIQHQALHFATTGDAADRRALRLLDAIGVVQSDLFERCVAMKDALEDDPVLAFTVFRNTMKQSSRSTHEARRAYYATALADFLGRGGSLDQIEDVASRTVRALESGAAYEWTVNDQDRARMCRADVDPSPGHVIQAGGHDVLGAGSMRVFRDERGALRAVVLGTFSGHYRTTAAECVHMKRHLVAAGVPEEIIVIQGGAAASPRGVSLALSKEVGAAAIERLETNAARFFAAAPLRRVPKTSKSSPSIRPVRAFADTPVGRTTAVFARAEAGAIGDVEGVRLDRPAPSRIAELEEIAQARGRRVAIEVVADEPIAPDARVDRVTLRATDVETFARHRAAMSAYSVGVQIGDRASAFAALELATLADYVVVDVGALEGALGPYAAIEAQGAVLDAARRANKPVVVDWSATEPTPERVHAAILRGVDAVLLASPPDEAFVAAIRELETQRASAHVEVRSKSLLEVRADANRRCGRRRPTREPGRQACG